MNTILRHQALELRNKLGKGPTAIVAHGANPGLISHFLKSALVDLAGRLALPIPQGHNGVDWATLAMKLGVKVIHIAERDTQKSKHVKKDNEFVNTWSVDGFISEAGQPAELGWGTHENAWPDGAKHHRFGTKNSIYIEKPGVSVRVKTWTPIKGQCLGCLITHNETISITDYLTIKKDHKVLYRPTVHYAYHPCDDALLSIHELVARGWRVQEAKRIMNSDTGYGGVDALGILLMGHALNAYWYGSILSLDEARRTVPFNTATSLQVAAGVLSGVAWAIENPHEGILEAEQMDYARILELAKPYLGLLVGAQTNWTPLNTGSSLLHNYQNKACPWQFVNFTSL